MSKLYGYYAGSRLLGLSTEKSDWNYCSVHTSSLLTKHKIYPDLKILKRKRLGKVKVEHIELCAYLTYLMNGFAFQVESLFVPYEFVDELDPNFSELVLKNRDLLIDRIRLCENVVSNIEYYRKKKAFEPQNYVHQIRIAASVCHFLKTDKYPLTNLDVCDPTAFTVIKRIKDTPEHYSRDDLDLFLSTYIRDIQEFDLSNDEEKFRFDATHAQTVINHFYT